MNDALRSQPTGGLQHVQRAQDVRLDVGLCRRVGMRNGDQRREMEDDVLARHDPADEGRISNVAAHEIQATPRTVRHLVEPTVAVEGVVQGQRGDVGSLTCKGLGQVRADEPVGPGDQNIDAVIGHGMSPLRQTEAGLPPALVARTCGLVATRPACGC